MQFITSMLNDCDNNISSKRVITLASFALCAIAFMCNLILGLTIDANIYQSMMYIVIAGLGFTASEQFATKK